jgi:hypothetical protein
VKPETAKRRLRTMLGSFTQGSVLHLLGEVFEEMAEEEAQTGEEGRRDQFISVARTLFVVSLGIDAACPR